MTPERRHKAINFDLQTQALREKFGEKGRREAYRKIGAYLASEGFEHRQGSGYRSTVQLSDLEAIVLAARMYEKMDWLYDCVNKLDVTNIGEEYDMDSIVKRRRRLPGEPRSI